MRNIPQYVCCVIPPHILTRVAEQSTAEASDDARTTLEHMRELATGRARTLIDGSAAAAAEEARKRRNVYDARHQTRLPGKLAMSEHKPRSADVEVNEAYNGSGATYDFYAQVFGRRSIDGKGMRLDSTVHYGTRFENAMWNGRQMVYGDGDGRIFNRFTASLDVIGHELTHGVTQFSTALGYSGQTGALNEHLSDAFGIMVKQYKLDQSASESDWLIGAELFGPGVAGRAVRSMAAPGTAYDDPVLGRDPQPSYMRDYVDTVDDNGGVHINSGILNHAFHRAAMAIGGKTWHVLGKIWYVAMTERLKPEADFSDFARATVDIAGELYGNGGAVQRIVAEAWSAVGLTVPLFGCAEQHLPIRRRRSRAAAIGNVPKWRQRPNR
ncbi:MAG TPA: M4 family metallopeptidase [Thermoanaerobaculia bacterium]|nr:M4 family metallopeptidase [Thermoanaerobaculia bacterium]